MTNSDDHARSVAWDFLAGFGLGALVAGAFAVLYAPKSGAELRGDLRHRAEDTRDAAERLLGDLRRRGEQLITDLKDAVESGRQAAAAKRKSLDSDRDAD